MVEMSDDGNRKTISYPSTGLSGSNTTVAAFPDLTIAIYGSVPYAVSAAHF
jgi:hypothetical protein